MRTLLYFTIGFSAACGLCAYTEELHYILPGIFAVLVFCALAGRNRKWISRVLAGAVGCAAGFGWFFLYNAQYLQEAAALDGVSRWAEIRISDYSYDTAYGMAFDGVLILEDKPYQLRVYTDKEEDITPGDYAYGEFRFRVTTPGGEQESTYHQGKGIFLLAYQTGEIRIEHYAPTRRDIPALLRQKLREIISDVFSQKCSPFATALLIGDTAELDYKTDTDLKISGIRHVAAVSGLHVSILFALISTVSLRNRWITALLGFPILFCFAAVAGFTPSVCRACIMSGLMLLAMLVNREYDGITALSFAVLILLLGNPLAVTSVSLQLSVSSVAGIYLFDPAIRKWLLSKFPEKKEGKIRTKLKNWFTASVSISLSTMILTVPLSAWYFGTVSLIGPLTNLLTLWIISGIFYGIMAVCAVSMLFPAGSVVLAKFVSMLIRYVLGMAEILADIPMAAVFTDSPYIMAWLILVYCLLIVFRAGQKRSAYELAGYGILGLCIALLISWTEPMLTDLRFSVLDVGQGQCLLLQAEGKTFLIDCGGDSDTKAADTAAEALLSQGISGLDGMILTHLDRDHAGGAANFLSRIETDLVILPPVPIDIPSFTEGKVIYADRDLQLVFGDTKIQIFAPTFPGNSNEMSLCILLDTKNCDILVTGDRSAFGERSLLRNADIPDVDVLVAGHHGSKNATCEELLSAVQPEIVCISAGRDNPYGHPAPQTLSRLAQHGCSVYRTDLQGTITIRR